MNLTKLTLFLLVLSLKKTIVAPAFSLLSLGERPVQSLWLHVSACVLSTVTVFLSFILS